uniref:Tankyrase 1-binding protein C-terminal domain-containing protein n=1 Tax=Poecilia mexicana TaxID=48701 RepID=A0A3B3YV35_9TELE
MEYLGDKLSVAHSQVSGWMGNVRRSFHGALNFLSGSAEREGRGEDLAGGFKRTNSLRSLASRSRESIRRFSLRSQQRLSLRRRTAPNTPIAVQQKQSSEVDSGTPVRDTDSQYGTWETGLRTDDSLTPATPSSESNLSPSPRKPTPLPSPGDQTSQSETTTTDGPSPSSSESQPLDFPDVPTTRLDNSALRSRVQLGKKRAQRVRPSKATRPSAAAAQGDGGDADSWLYRDSTEAKAEIKNDDSESEEPAKGAESGPAAPPQPQRVALFPGVDPSALKAQLKKRVDSDNQTDGPASSPSQQSRSPKSPFLPRAARVLPPPGGKENGQEESPQWLKELKSKKRLSHFENES